MSLENRKFYKEQFIKSKKYKYKKDLLNALLEENILYTEEQVKKLINNYLEVIL